MKKFIGNKMKKFIGFSKFFISLLFFMGTINSIGEVVKVDNQSQLMDSFQKNKTESSDLAEFVNLKEGAQIFLETSAIYKEAAVIFSQVYLAKYLLKILNNANSYKQDSGKDTYPVIDIGILVAAFGGTTYLIKNFPSAIGIFKKGNSRLVSALEESFNQRSALMSEYYSLLHKGADGKLLKESLIASNEVRSNIKGVLGEIDVLYKNLIQDLSNKPSITKKSLKMLGKSMRLGGVLAGVTLASYELSNLGTIALSKESIEDYLLKTQKWHDELLSSLELISL